LTGDCHRQLEVAAQAIVDDGAGVPARGLFVLESDVDAFPEIARTWAAEHCLSPLVQPDQPVAGGR
jgi:hypothetical protein